MWCYYFTAACETSEPICLYKPSRLEPCMRCLIWASLAREQYVTAANPANLLALQTRPVLFILLSSIFFLPQHPVFSLYHLPSLPSRPFLARRSCTTHPSIGNEPLSGSPLLAPRLREVVACPVSGILTIFLWHHDADLVFDCQTRHVPSIVAEPPSIDSHL